MEKPLAEAAGLGWQGKHTNLVSRDFGSWLFLGAILTERRLEPDAPEADHCGSCRACLDVCPTKAFPAPYRLDARRCISYLTIEHKGPDRRGVPRGDRQPHLWLRRLPRRLPVEQVRAPSPASSVSPRATALVAPRLAELSPARRCGLPRSLRAGPVKRIGRDRFLRNVLIAIGNSGDPRSRRRLIRLLDDPSPLVRGAAVWAAGRLDPEALRSQEWRSDSEQDRSVLEEWNLQLPRGGGRSCLDVSLHSADTNGAVGQPRDGDDLAARGAEGAA